MSDDDFRADGGASTNTADERIDAVLETIQRRTLIRRISFLGLLVGVALATYYGMGYLSGSSVPKLMADFDRQMPTFLENVSDFLHPNFVDFTIYSKENSVGGWSGFVESLTHPETFLETAKTGSNSFIVSVAVMTIITGFTGTVLGFPLALLFGVLGSERVTPFPFNFLFRGTMSTIRAVPALVWVLIYIPLASISPISAILAIATDTIGNLGRLFTDELEEIDDGPIEAIRLTGANGPQIISFGMLSQVSTPFIAWTLYIHLKLGFLQFNKAVAALITVVIIVLTVELLSSRLRAPASR